MKFQGQVRRRSRLRKRKFVPLLIPAILFAIVFFLYFINMRLTPTYVDMRKSKHKKLHLMSLVSAIKSRIANVLDVNDIIENVPTESGGMVTTKFNTEIINQSISRYTKSCPMHLDQAEAGNLDLLPPPDRN